MGNTLISNTGDSCAIRGDAAGTPAASLLTLAAAPTFVVMALWSAVAGGPAEMMCSSGGSAVSLNGMAAMYATPVAIQKQTSLATSDSTAGSRVTPLLLVEVQLNRARRLTATGNAASAA